MKTKIFTLVILLNAITINIATAQAFDWAQGVGSTADDIVMTQKTDNSGNHYICGYFSGNSIQFGNETLTNINGNNFLPDLYLVKYDSNWNVLWAFTPDNDANAYGDIYNALDIDVDNNGNCYLTGSFRISSITFGNHILNNTNPNGEFDPFLVKFNNNGTVQWAKNFGGMYRDKGRCVAIDPSGAYVYMAGWFYSDTITVGGISYVNTDNTENTSDIFLTKFDASGNIIYTVTNGSNNIDHYQDIAIDTQGNIIAAGTFKGDNITFGNQTLNNFNLYFDDAFMVKYNTEGSVIWVKHFDGELNETPTSLFVDQSNDMIYMSGIFNSSALRINNQTVTGNYAPGNATYDGFLVKYLSNGQRYFLVSIQGNDDESITSITVDANENVYFTGSFVSNEMHLWPNTTVENSDNSETSDMFIAKINSMSQLQWVKTATGTADDVGTSIDINDDDVLVFGQSNSDVSFNNISLTNQGGYDIFMARLSQQMNIFSGRVYYDANNNGHMDNDDFGVSNMVLQIDSNYYLTGEDGNFQLALPAGNFTLTPLPSEYFTATPETINFTFSSTGEVNNNNNIALTSIVDTAHLETNILSLSTARKDQEFVTYLTFKNTGTVPLDTTKVSYPLNEDLQYNYSDPPEDKITDDSISWNIYNLMPFEERTIKIHQTVDTVLSGDSLNFKSTNNTNIIWICFGWWVCRPVLWYIDCYYVPDCYPQTDPNTGQTYTQCDTVPVTDPITGDTTGYVTDSIFHCDYYYWPVCWWHGWCILITWSHDPNAIYVTPNDSLPFTPAQVSAGQPLEYTINFQNTGNDTCFNAVVLDTLDSNLDISTFEMLGASHKYKVSLNNRVLKFTFNNILLPDSTTNEPESHGYIKYKIKPLTNLQIGDSICNRADIYFDYEPQVLTNRVVTHIANPTGIDENKQDGMLNKHKIKIAPNPFNQNATVYLDKSIKENTIFDLYDITGRLVKEIVINHAKAFTLNRGNLKNGMYIYALKTKNNRLIDRGKIILK